MRQDVVGRRGVATDEVRRHNLSAVLDRIHLVDAVSRSSLATLTGLNRSTIRDLISELVDLGLVVEDAGTTTGGPGRPSSLARVRSAGAVVLAVELEIDYTTVATIGLGGRILDRATAANPAPPASPDAVLDHLERLASPLLGQLPNDHQLAGIGVAAAGLIRHHDGLMSYSPNLGWSGVALGAMIAERFDVARVRVANEADTAALAEFRRGAARDVDNLVYVSGAVGLGVGIIHERRPLSGSLGYAGEVGHTVINPGGRPCRCGSTGCLETEVGQEALARLGGLAARDLGDGMTDEVLRLARLDDTTMLDALRQVGYWLGLGVGNLVNIFNPDLIIFGGFYAPIFPLLEPSILDTAERTSLAAPWGACTIGGSELGSDARLIGAGELVFADVIADPSSVTA